MNRSQVHLKDSTVCKHKGGEEQYELQCFIYRGDPFFYIDYYNIILSFSTDAQYMEQDKKPTPTRMHEFKFFSFYLFFFGFYLISITWTRLWWGRWQPVRSASAAGVWAWVCITILWWVTVSPAVTIGSRPRRVAIWVSRSVGSSIKSRSPVITWWGSGGSRAALWRNGDIKLVITWIKKKRFVLKKVGNVKAERVSYPE